MLPVEFARSYQEIVWHLLDEIQRLQMENISLKHDVERATANHAADINAQGKTSVNKGEG